MFIQAHGKKLTSGPLISLYNLKSVKVAIFKPLRAKNLTNKLNRKSLKPFRHQKRLITVSNPIWLHRFWLHLAKKNEMGQCN